MNPFSASPPGPRKGAEYIEGVRPARVPSHAHKIYHCSAVRKSSTGMVGGPMSISEDSKQQTGNNVPENHQQNEETSADFMKRSEAENNSTQLESCLEPLSKKAKLSASSGQDDVSSLGMAHIIPRTPTPSFTKRDKEQAALEAAVINKTEQHIINVAITGPPGVGKTELALKFIEQHSAEFHHILWIKCNSTNTIHNAFKDFANKLGITEENFNMKDENELKLMLYRVYNAVRLCRTLFIFDNAFSQNDIQKFLPPENSVFIIITSQFTKWDCGLTLSMECFTHLEAKNFLSQHLVSRRPKDLEDLYNLLDRSPLALQVVASIIKQVEKIDNNKFTIGNFILFYKQQASKILYYSCPNTKYFFFHKSLLATFSQAVQNLKKSEHGPLAIKILNMISFIEAENIPVSMFKFVSNTEENEHLEAFSLLKEHSLITYKGENVSVCKFLHQTLQIMNKNQTEVLSELLTLLLHQIVTHEVGAKFPTTCLVLHAEQAWSFIGNNDELVTKFSLIAVAVGSYKLIRNHIDSLERILSWNNEHFLQIQLKNVTYKIESYQQNETIALCDKAVIVIEKMNYNIKMKYQFLVKKALRLYHMKGFKEAWQILQDVYQQQRQMFGLDHVDTLETLNEMRETVSKLAEQEEYEALETWLSFINERINDDKLDYNKTLQAMEYFSPEEREDDVMELFDKFHKTLVSLVGESHESTLKILLYKANFLGSFNRHDEKMETLMYCNKKQMEYNLDNTKTIETMIFTAMEVTDKEKAWKYCFSLLEEKTKNPCSNLESVLLLIGSYGCACPIEEQINALKLHNVLLMALKTSPIKENYTSIMQTLNSKVDCLIKSENYYEAWNTLMVIYLKHADMKEDNDRTLIKMCRVSSQLKKGEYTQFCLSILNEKACDRHLNHQHTLFLLQRCENFIARETMLASYDLLYNTVVALSGPKSPLAFLIQLTKALCCLYLKERYGEAWQLYNSICLILEEDPVEVTKGDYFSKSAMCESISSLCCRIRKMC